jgi:hypothetical protein
MGESEDRTPAEVLRSGAIHASSASSGLRDLTSSVIWYSLAAYCGRVALLPLSKLMRKACQFLSTL